MTTTPTPSRAVAALLTGVATAGYYATPDVVASRAARGWTKAALTAVSLAAAVPDLRATRAAVQQQRELDGTPPLSDVLAPAVVRHRAAVVATGSALLAGTVALVVVTERWIFRAGQARASAGIRLPHTRTGLLMGALAAAVTLVPVPPPHTP